MEYTCNNPECEKFGIKDYYSSETFKVDSKGHLVGSNCLCPKCGAIREETNPNSNIPLSEKNIGIGKFSSASPEQKKEMLRKRTHEDFNKKVKEKKDHLMNQAMTEMKGMSTKK